MVPVKIQSSTLLLISILFTTTLGPTQAMPQSAGTTPDFSPSLMLASSTVNASQLVATIDAFAFDLVTTLGVGGFLIQDVRPVVLFRNGQALRNVRGLSHPRGLEAHRQEKPNDWTRWRRNGNRIELQTSSGWRALPFNTTYQTLPNQFRLNGTYRAISGGGDVAMGGGTTVAIWGEYSFFLDGRVTRNGGAGMISPESAVSSTAATQNGQYQIDGLLLRMRYSDGSTENRVIITHPADPSAIWLDGIGYSQN